MILGAANRKAPGQLPRGSVLRLLLCLSTRAVRGRGHCAGPFGGNSTVLVG